MMKRILTLASSLLFLVSCGGGKDEKAAAMQSADSIVSVDSTEAHADSLPRLPFQVATVFFAGRNAEGEYLHIAGLPDSLIARRINAALDSVANHIVGFSLAPYIENPGVKDSNLVRLQGEVTLSFRPATYHAGLVSFSFLVRRYGQKLGDSYQAVTYDTQTGRQVRLDDMVNGGAPVMLSSIRRHLADADAATRYDCAFSSTWNEVDEFVVTPEGLRWEIEETAFPDRQFCKDGVHLLMDWETLRPILNLDSPQVEKLLKRD